MAVGNARPYMGWNSCISVAEETTLNTYVTGTANFIEFNSEGFKRERDVTKLESVNNTRNFTKRIVGNESISGSIESDLDVGSDGLMLIIKQAMGGTVTNVANTSASADEYTHTFNIGGMESNKGTSTASDVKGLSFAIKRGDTSATFTYSGCRVNTLTIKGEVGNPVVMSAEIVGMAASVTSTMPTISYSNLVPLYFKDVSITIGDSVTNATTAEYYTSFELTINNNINSDVRALGSRSVVQLPPQKREVMLKLGQRFDTLTAYNRFTQDTLTAVKISMMSEQTVGAGTANSVYSMYLNLADCRFKSNEPQVGGNDVLASEIEADVMYNSEQGYDIQIVAYNGTANYA